MDYQIVVGSSCDFNEKQKKEIPHATVPFVISIDEENLVDDESLTVDMIIKKMKNSVRAIRTACPSPNQFLEKYKEGEAIFVVTISSQLSGTYSSAMTAKNMYQEQFGEKFIHVFDSLSAAIAETMIAVKIKEYMDQNLSLDDVVAKVDEYIGELKTVFVLENLDNLIKNGRMSRLKGMFAQFLHIKPILGANGKGEIELIDKARGTKKALKKLVDAIGNTDLSKKDRLGIVHCNAPEKAEYVKSMILEKYPFKEIITTQANGLSAVYMDDGGIVIAY